MTVQSLRYFDLITMEFNSLTAYINFKGRNVKNVINFLLKDLDNLRDLETSTYSENTPHTQLISAFIENKDSMISKN